MKKKFARKSLHLFFDDHYRKNVPSGSRWIRLCDFIGYENLSEVQDAFVKIFLVVFAMSEVDKI